eukprot:4589502-Amphidinium_carterae.1
MLCLRENWKGAHKSSETQNVINFSVTWKVLAVANSSIVSSICFLLLMVSAWPQQQTKAVPQPPPESARPHNKMYNNLNTFYRYSQEK